MTPEQLKTSILQYAIRHLSKNSRRKTKVDKGRQNKKRETFARNLRK